MAIPFLNNVDLNHNQLLDALFQVLGSDPGSPVEGQFWFNSTDDALKYYDGVGIQSIKRSELLARANHTGTQLAATISDLAATVQAYRLDQFAAPTANVSFNSQKITNLANGTGPQDAATYGQLEAIRQGVTYKAAVEAAMTSNVNITIPGTDTFDGVTVANGEAVLLTAQTTGTENGIYVFNGIGSAMTRRDDADTYQELDAGSQTFAQGGTANSGQWRQNTELTGFGGQTWQKVGSGSTYVAGNGLTESPAGTFNVGGTAQRITVSADAVDIASDYVGQTSIVTLGTIGTGTWQGTAVGVAYGGTGAATAAGARSNLGAAGKYTALIGDGVATAYVISVATHGLGTGLDKIVQVYEVATGDQVITDARVVQSGGTQGDVRIAFSTAPASNAMRVVIMG